MAHYDELQLDNLRSHDLQKHTLMPMIATDGGLMKDEGKETQEIIGCHTCNMGLDEAAQNTCPGGDLFDVEEVFGPKED